MRIVSEALFAIFLLGGFRFAYAVEPDKTSLPTATSDGTEVKHASAEAHTAVENPISFDYLKLVWADTKETATEPLHWDGEDWRNVGLVTGGLVAIGAFADRPIRDAAQRNRTTGADNFFRQVQKFGTKQYGLPVLAGFYVYGKIGDDDNAQATALDGVSASVISALVTSTIKGVVGRARPNTGFGPGHFRPLQGDYSFPSGHATGAFTFASVIAAHYDSPWVDATAYGIASLVAVARIEQNAHWTSDVIAGGLIGGLIGHHLVEFNREVRERGISLAPTVGVDANELTLTWNF